MSEFAARLSSYNLLNYLLSGVVFATLAEKILGRSLVSQNVLAAAFIYYFIGLVVSRFGSVVLEPILKRTGVVVFADHKDYVEASQTDPKLDVLSEQNNVYRTLAAAIVLLLLLALWGAVVGRLPLLGAMEPWIALIVVLALFVLAYRKQSGYIVSRVEASRRRESAQRDE